MMWKAKCLFQLNLEWFDLHFSALTFLWFSIVWENWLFLATLACQPNSFKIQSECKLLYQFLIRQVIIFSYIFAFQQIWVYQLGIHVSHPMPTIYIHWCSSHICDLQVKCHPGGLGWVTTRWAKQCNTLQPASSTGMSCSVLKLTVSEGERQVTGNKWWRMTIFTWNLEQHHRVNVIWKMGIQASGTAEVFLSPAVCTVLLLLIILAWMER